MAKQIKTVKCPQCGSTRADMIREDHYRCQSCSTEFWLDDDDITIHHKHEFSGETSSSLQGDFLKQNRKVIYIVVGIFGFVLFVLPFLGRLFGGSSSSPATRSSSVFESAGRVSYWWDWGDMLAFIDSKGQPIIMAFGNREAHFRGKDDQATSLAVTFTPDQKKVLKTQEIPPLKGIDKAKAKVLSDGRIYVILNGRRLYEVNRSNYELREIIPQQEFAELTELSKGVTQISFGYSNEDKLELMTSLGKKYILYPIIKKLYPDKQSSDAYKAMLPQPQIYTGFTFSSVSSIDFTDELIQLVKYQYRWQVGYPKEDPSFQWQKDYGGSGIFTDRSPYRKVFISGWYKDRSRLVSYQDFTPEAYYFSPKVLHYDADQVLITYRPSADPEAPHILKALDARTAEVRWTYQGDSDDKSFSSPDFVLSYKGGYIIVNYRTCVKFSRTGTLVYGQDVQSLLEGEVTK